jgi:hypothetical protein
MTLAATRSITYIAALACDPPHGVTHPEKAEELRVAFARDGWRPSAPALVGYEHSGRVQLLSGSHRHAAALATAILIPVVLVDYDEVRHAFGNVNAWLEIMARGEREASSLHGWASGERAALSCGWCTPLSQRRPGESHGICAACQRKLDDQIRERMRSL